MKFWLTNFLCRDSLDGLSSDEELPSGNPSNQPSNLDPDDNPGDADADGDGSAYTEDIFIAYDEEDQDQEKEEEKETSECVQVLQKSGFNSSTIEEERTRDLLNKAIVRSHHLT